MSKAMVIINMPICCGACRLFQNNGNDCWCSITREDTTSLAMPESCPLKPLPQKKVPVFNPNDCNMEKEIQIIYEIEGYNNCLDEILGGVE